MERRTIDAGAREAVVRDGVVRPHAPSVSLRERLLRSHLLVGTIDVVVVVAAVVAVVYARDATVQLSTGVQPRAVASAAQIVRTIDTGLAMLMALFVAGTAATLAVSI